jgi:hypothetical protein
MADIPLNNADESIIEELRKGRNIPANIAETTGYDRQYINQRLRRLNEHEVVTNIGNGVYELFPDEVPTYD